MIIILLQKIKKERSFVFKKIIIPILIFIVFILVNCYYFFNYYVNKNLSFTEEGKFLFALIVVGSIGFAIFYLFLIFDRAKLFKIINKIKKDIIESEDNCILANRDTQEMVLNYFKEG